MADVKPLSNKDRRLLKDRLSEAAREGRVDDVSLLSTHFIRDVNTLGGALDWACRRRQLNVVTWLVEHTVLRDDAGWLGWALEVASRYGQWNIVKWLVTNTQTDVNYTSGRAGENNSVLHLVIRANTNNSSLPTYNMKELCRRVYVCGEDVNVQDDYGYTSLHVACFDDISDAVGALLLAGADETITNDRGLTPVQRAVRYKRVKVLSLMDVSSKWKRLVRSHRLRRRTAVRVMMTLVKWKVQQTRSMWTRAIMTLHAIMILVRDKDTPIRNEDTLVTDGDTLINDEDTLNRDITKKFAIVVGGTFDTVYLLSLAASAHAVTQGLN
jgi:hypothetical protein